MKKIFLLILLFTISNFAFAESVVEEGPKSKTEISNQPGTVNVTVEHKEVVNEKTEKVIVDKELTNSVMQKFEDADKRRQQATSEEIQVLKDELEYLKKEKEKLMKQNSGDEEFKKMMDKRLASTEIRIRRLEKYLGMDEAMIDYYQRKRSPWDLVWRSAVFPGWGHRYAREDYTGNTYSTSILVLAALGFLVDYQANAASDAAKTALFNGVVVKNYQYSSLGIPATFSNTFVLNSFASYNSAMSAVDSQKQLSQNLYSAAIGLYLIQLVHAYFTGLEWSKIQPKDYTNEGLLKPTGFNIKSKVDTNNYAKVPKRGIRYEVEFSTNF